MLAGSRITALAAAAMILRPTPQMVSAQTSNEPGGATQEPAPLTLDELDILTARIAFYPDELVALTISASLYPLQIVHAARFLEEKEKSRISSPATSGTAA